MLGGALSQINLKLPESAVHLRNSVGVRKNNPRLRETVNAWIKQLGTHSTFANVLNGRYLHSTTYEECR